MLQFRRELWYWVAAARETILRRAASFSVFALLPDRWSPRPVLDPDCNMVDLVMALRAQLPRKDVTWVVHVDEARAGDRDMLLDSVVCDNVLWTHRNFREAHFRDLTLVPYLFDFLLLPASEWTNGLRGCDIRRTEQRIQCRHDRLLQLISLAKVILLLPLCDTSSDALSQDVLPVGAWTMVATTEKDIVRLLDIDVSRQELRSGEVFTVVAVTQLFRYTRHEFDDTIGRNGTILMSNQKRIYDLVYNARRSWTPVLHVRERQSEERTREYTIVPRVRDGGHLLDLHGFTFGRSGRVVMLTKLAMVNMKLIDGLGPSLRARQQLWDSIMNLTQQNDCVLCNVCRLGTTTVWCDSSFQPRPGAISLHELDRRGFHRCTKLLSRILKPVEE